MTKQAPKTVNEDMKEKKYGYRAAMDRTYNVFSRFSSIPHF